MGKFISFFTELSFFLVAAWVIFEVLRVVVG
jgi:hypothetical protein